MKVAALTILAALCASAANALEPVSALDDGFGVPSADTVAPSVYAYPGMESFADGWFALGAWNMPYGISELAVTTGVAGYSRGGFGFSAAYSGTGFDLYGDEHEKIGVSWAPHRMVSAGVRLTRTAVRIRGFGTASASSCDMGVIVRPHPRLYCAGAWEDIAGAKLGRSEEPLDGHRRFAVSWRFTESATIIASASHVRRFGTSSAAGVTVDASGILTLGVIGADKPDRIEFLCGVNARGAVFSYRGSYHRDLGMTHGFSLGRQIAAAVW